MSKGLLLCLALAVGWPLFGGPWTAEAGVVEAFRFGEYVGFLATVGTPGVGREVVRLWSDGSPNTLGGKEGSTPMCADALGG